MAILTRPLLRPQQRFDLEDFEVLLSAMRTDAKFWHKRFMTDEAYIVKGFEISDSFIGQNSAQVVLDGSTLINANATEDFSWYTGEVGASPITIPTGSSGLQPGRNFVELQLNTQDGTPLQRAFWDPSANGGEGIEFTNEVNTVTDLNIAVQINQSGFNTADPDLIPLAIIDVDGSLTIKGIQDRRDLFFRLGTPDDPQDTYVWGSQIEPTTVLTFTVPSGTAFDPGETVTFGSGATATVVVGGTDNIQVNEFSNTSYNPGDSVIGGTSGANATLDTYYNNFDGADKDIRNFRDLIAALMTEVKNIKGTTYWFEASSAISLPNLLNYINSFLTPISAGAKFSWDGSSLSITDDATSGQATSDVIAGIRTPGLSTDIYLSRQDGSGGSAVIAIPDENVLYVELPDSGDRTYSESGPSNTNFQVTARGSFSPTDKNFVVAYREGSKLIVKGLGELEAGETVQVGDQISEETLSFIGAADETDTTPPYPFTPSSDLPNTFDSSNNLTQAIGTNAENVNDFAAAVLAKYREYLLVTTAAAANDNEVQGPISASSTLTLPLDSRDSDSVKQYKNGAGSLKIKRNGVMLQLGEDYTEDGSAGTFQNTITILVDLEVGERLEFEITTDIISA